jgi:hypothetical protein
MFGRIQSLLSEIEDAMGDKICCKILYFLGDRKPNSISVMLECVTKDSMEEVTLRRRSMGYELVRKCPSPDFFFPDKQRIRVDVAGSFALSKYIRKSYYFLTFFPIAAENFICFPVYRNAVMGCAAHGIISFKADSGMKKDLHAIHHDPWNDIGKPQRHLKMPSVLGEMEAAADDRSDSFNESMYNNLVSKEFAINITHFNIKSIKESN